jgi:hypothetical protein
MMKAERIDRLLLYLCEVHKNNLNFLNDKIQVTLSAIKVFDSELQILFKGVHDMNLLIPPIAKYWIIYECTQ